MELPKSKDKGELVERQDFLSFILIAPGYCLKDFKVRISGGTLAVEAPDFELSRPLGCEVDPSGVREEYRNGVLSVRIAKKF